MLRLPVITILLFAPIIFGSVSGSIFQAPITPTGAFPISTPVSNVQSHNQFYTPSRNQYNATTRKPYGTWGGHNSAATSSSSLSDLIPDLRETCMLWNTSCSGNKTKAMNEFFTNTSHALYNDACFLGSPVNCENMTSSEQSLRYGQVKDWMRSPQCYSEYAEWSSLMKVPGPQMPLAIDSGGGFVKEVQYLCCSGCTIHGGNVDIYYWPEANASTSCLDIIGNSRFPLDHGATTDATGTYWGCTGQNSKIIKTAHITTIQSVKHKVSLYNPWSSNPCSWPPSLQFNPTTSTGTENPHPSIFARAHSLVTKSSIQNTNLSVAFATVGNYTFTSPSIYANFHDIITHDICGDATTVVETMLTFSPGELSTWAGQIDPYMFRVKPFDFRDLPCPPQSVMEENWYKPQEGQPYRPLIALPKQILEMNAKYGGCGGDFFTGIDPPRSLTPVTISVSTTTSKDPESTTATAVPSPSPQSGARNTATDRASPNAPSHTPTLEQAKETHSMILGLKQGVPDPHSHLNGPVIVVPQMKSMLPGHGQQETSSEVRQGSSVGDNSTPRSKPNNQELPTQTIASLGAIASSDPALHSTFTRQDSGSSNRVSIVMGPEANDPNPPSAHLPATPLATNETPQDPSATKQDQKPNMLQLVGADDPSQPRTAVSSVPTVDRAINQYGVDPSSNPVIASPPAQVGDPGLSVAAVQIGLTSTANNIAVGDNSVLIEPSAVAATTFPQTSESSILRNGFKSPALSIETPKSRTYPNTNQVTTAAAIPAVDVVKPPLVATLDVTTVDGRLTTPATPGHLPLTLDPGAPELSEQTKSSEAPNTKIYDTSDHPTIITLTGKLGSGDHSVSDSPLSEAGSTSIGDILIIGSSTGNVGSTSTADQSTFDSPTGKVGSTSTSDHSINIGSPTGNVGSTSTADQSTSNSPTGKAGSTSTGDHSTIGSPTGNVGSTSTDTQALKGQARSWKSCEVWKKAGLTVLLIGIVFY